LAYLSIEREKIMLKKRLSKKKKILLVLAILIVGLILISTQIKQKTVINSSLSERSKEFLEGKKFAPNSQWTNVNLSGPQKNDTRNQRIGKDDCYSYVIPYRVTVGHYDEQPGTKCYMRVSFDKPRGAILTYISKTEAKGFDDFASIKQRREQTEEFYPEEVKTIGTKTFIMFRGKGGSYEKNAFYFSSSNEVFVFNLITRTNENLDKEFDKMLATVEFVKQ
jgi:hypothetical protein